MSILNPIPKDVIQQQFTHYGWFCGLVPVYLADVESEGPLLVERNWVPEWYFGLVELLFGWFCTISSLLNPEFVPMFPILISGEIKA